MSALKVSVAMTTYNGARYLPAQLESIVSQVRTPDEIVICDDQSTDGTREILEQFERRSAVPTQTVYNERNIGYVLNFEKAVSACSGEVIFLCDQDDVWHPDKVRRMMLEFELRPELTFLYSNARLTDAEGTALGATQFQAMRLSAEEAHLIHSGRALEVLLRRNVVTGATAAFRRELFGIATPFCPAWSHDEWLAIVASLYGRVDFVDECLTDYRQHPGNQIGLRARRFSERVADIFSSRGDFYVRSVKRTEALVELVRQRAVRGSALPSESYSKLINQLAHVRFRAGLAANRLRRPPMIAHEILTGRYWTYSYGLRSVVRDLFESA
jgi:glycosyltransferase involved in cell wall biosynthesis